MRPLEFGTLRLGPRGRTGPAALVDVKDPIRDIVTGIFNRVMQLVADLFTTIVGSFLTLDPNALPKFDGIYSVTTVAYFSLLGLFGLSMLGYFQLFPGAEKADPLRFLGRAVPATFSLWIVNPPGSSSLFGKGAYAWAMVATNTLVEMYLESNTISFESNQLADALGGPFVLVGFALSIGGLAVVAEVLLLLGLMLRQVVIHLSYAIYPLLIAFWLVDAGPLKYAKQFSDKLFKTTVTLFAGGPLLAGLFALGLAIMSGDAQVFAGGTPTTAPAPSATFSSHSATGIVLNQAFKMVTLIVICLLPLLFIKQMLGDVGDAAASTLTTAATVTTTVVSGAVTAGAGSVAVSGASAVAKQGAATAAKKAGTTVAKKGVTGAAKHAAKKAPGAVKKAGKEAAKRAPKTMREAGERATRRGASAARDQLDAATHGGQPPEEEDGPPENEAPRPNRVSTGSVRGAGSGGSRSSTAPSNPSVGSGDRYSRR